MALVTVDSDGQHRLEDLIGMLDDLVATDADMVIGFGRYAVRPKVKAGADAFIMSLAELPELVAAHGGGF